jgi:hypothetical protein
MTRNEYRELCRFVVADRLKIDAEQVRVQQPPCNPRRAGLVPFRHTVDLCWETENSLSRYVHIGRVLWQDRADVAAEEVLLLQQIKEKLGAHKALFFTNTGFSRQAVLAADEAGIGLLLIKPTSAVAARSMGLAQF